MTVRLYRHTVHEGKARVANSHSKQVEHARLELDRAKQDLADDPTNAAAQARVKNAERDLHVNKAKHLEAKRHGESLRAHAVLLLTSPFASQRPKLAFVYIQSAPKSTVEL
jgi:hypothetical protein